MSETTVPHISLNPVREDVFIGSKDLIRLFTGIADYLSLWCALYGLRERDLRVSKVSWLDDHMFFFRILDRAGRPVSPARYDPRMPNVDRIFQSRESRIRTFIAMQPWFRDKMAECDLMFLRYLGKWKLEADDVEVANRWTDRGILLMRVIWKSTAPTTRRYMTHLKYGDERQ